MFKFGEFFNKIKNFDKILFYLTLFIVLLFGVILRLKVYFFNMSFWYDEASLGINFFDLTYLKCFKPLVHYQVAPPFFLIVSKFLLDISNKISDIYIRDMVLRFFPMISSVISLFLFCYLSHKMFNHKYLTLASSAIFAFHRTAIAYAAEFKQYSVELLFSLILLTIFFKIDFKNISKRNLLFYSLIFCISPWFSSSSFFILASGFLVILIDIIKRKIFDYKKLLILFIPSIINFIVFYLLYYKPISKANWRFMQKFWSILQPSFFDFKNFIKLFTSKTLVFLNINFDFAIILTLILSIVILICYKNYKRIILILAPLLLTIIASFMHFYPYQNRLILFLLPCFAIILSMAVLLLKETKLSTFILSAIILYFSFNKICLPPIDFIYHKSCAREWIVEILKDDPKLENVFLASTSLFQWYSYPVKKVKNKDLTSVFCNFNESDKEKINENLDKLSKGDVKFVFMPVVDRKKDKTIKIRELLSESEKIKILDLKYPNYELTNKSAYLLKFVKL